MLPTLLARLFRMLANVRRAPSIGMKWPGSSSTKDWKDEEAAERSRRIEIARAYYQYGTTQILSNQKLKENSHDHPKIPANPYPALLPGGAFEPGRFRLGQADALRRRGADAHIVPVPQAPLER